jgi:dephospho-CoA kinase
MKVFGLTGGIACGKGTVASMFAQLGAAVIDADDVAHEVIAPGKPAWRELVEFFGESILRPDRTIDRKKLADIVFADAAARRRLNAITHPRITEEIQTRLADLAQSVCQIAIVEAALIGEGEADSGFDDIIVVYANPSAQIARLIDRDGLAEQQAQRRIETQVPANEKRKFAKYVIDNSGSIEQTREQVKILWGKLTRTPS